MKLILPLVIVAFLGSVTPKVNFAYLENSFHEFDGTWTRYKLNNNLVMNHTTGRVGYQLKYEGIVHINFNTSDKLLHLEFRNKGSYRAQLYHGKVNTTSDEFNVFSPIAQGRPPHEFKITGYEPNYFITLVFKTLEESLQRGIFGYIWVYDGSHMPEVVVNYLKSQIFENFLHFPQNTFPIES